MFRLNSIPQLRYILTISLYTMILSYFAWQATYGAKGLNAYMKKKNELVIAREKLMHLDIEHAELEYRTLLLQPDALDRDLVDELSRKNLGLADPKDKILLQPKYDKSISK